MRLITWNVLWPVPTSHRQVAPVALEARIDHPETPFDVIVAATEWEPPSDHFPVVAEVRR